MTRAYLRYEQAASFGVICSNSNVVYDRTGRLLITAALENIAIWNIKQGTLVLSLRPIAHFANACPPPPLGGPTKAAQVCSAACYPGQVAH